MTPATPPDLEAHLVIARTAVRRSTVLGLGALGALVLASPAAALDAGVVTDTTGTVTEVTEPVSAAAAPVVDPLTAPLAGPVEDTVALVEATVATVTGQAPAGPAPEQAPPPAPGPAPSGSTDPAPVPGPAGPAGQAPQQGAPAPAADGTVTAASVGGTGFAASPGSIAALDRSAFRSGTGTAANPMSLFGAPQVALPPALESGAVTTPQVFTPAGGALPDLIPVGTPESVPGYLTALAASVVAAAAGAHVAALRSRRVAGTA